MWQGGVGVVWWGVEVVWDVVVWDVVVRGVWWGEVEWCWVELDDRILCVASSKYQ